MRNRPFWSLLQVMFFTAMGMYLIIVQSVVYLVDIGFAPLQAAGAFGSAAMLSVAGVASAGWLADRYGHKRAATASFTGTFLGIALLYALSYRSSHWLLAGYVCLFGICQGARGPIAASLSARLFAGPGMATVYGTIYACMSVGSGVGALLAGVLHDVTGGYRASFVLAMVCVGLASMPFWTSDALIPARKPNSGDRHDA
jgi:MFS family permease